MDLPKGRRVRPEVGWFPRDLTASGATAPSSIRSGSTGQARAWDDDDFKRRLLAEPEAVLRDAGIDVPPGIEVRAEEDEEIGDTNCLRLPPKPAMADLIDDDLGSTRHQPVARAAAVAIAAADSAPCAGVAEPEPGSVGPGRHSLGSRRDPRLTAQGREPRRDGLVNVYAAGHNFARRQGSVEELKTCDHLKYLEADASSFGYLHQLAFYRSLLAPATGEQVPVYLIAVEKREPYRGGVWRIDPGVLAVAERDNEAALERLVRCRQLDQWETGAGAERRHQGAHALRSPFTPATYASPFLRRRLVRRTCGAACGP